jgi:anti-sigma factor RsiW
MIGKKKLFTLRKQPRIRITAPSGVAATIATPNFMQRLSETDITNYVLNELEPSERLFVESLMLGCEESRADTLAMMEMARLLEDGMDRELSVRDFELDQTRRDSVFAQKTGTFWNVLGNAAATIGALAACVAFSVLAPSVSRLAFERDFSQSHGESFAAQAGDAGSVSDVVDPGEFPTFASETLETVAGSTVVEDLPTRVLFPTGAVNFVEMPISGLGGDSN